MPLCCVNPDVHAFAIARRSPLPAPGAGRTVVATSGADAPGAVLVGSRELALTLRLQGVDDIRLDAGQCTVIPVGAHAFIHLIDVPLASALPCDTLIDYDLLIDHAGIADWAPHLLYGEARRPNFVLRSRSISCCTVPAVNRTTRRRTVCSAWIVCWPRRMKPLSVRPC